MNKDSVYTQRVIRTILLRTRSTHIRAKERRRSEAVDQIVTWSQCLRRNQCKTWRLIGRARRKPDIDLMGKQWKSVYTFQKAKLTRLYGYFEAWSAVQFKLLEKINNQKFPQEKGYLWQFIYRKQRAKYKSLNFVQRKVSNCDLLKRQRAKLYMFKKINRKTESDREWMICFLSQKRKLLGLYRDQWTRK